MSAVGGLVVTMKVGGALEGGTLDVTLAREVEEEGAK